MRRKTLDVGLLWPVLITQAVLTLPWLWRTAPFTDEALYLRAGHQVWAHWLHNAPLPAYADYFSGAPVFYPPLGAALDSAGGLAAARGLSLVLMLGSTVLVYLAASRLFGRRAAFFASALFAVCGLAVHNGAFAAFNPLALFLLAVGAWAAANAGDEGYRWIAVCAAALALANVAKYATLAWDPLVIGIVALHGWGKGVADALGRGFSLAATVAVLDAGLLLLGGAQYVTGVRITTVFRTLHFGEYQSPAVIAWRAFVMTGALVLPALLGVIVSVARRESLPVIALIALLAVGGLIAPVDQAHLGQIGALDKNLCFGLPFVAVAAGYTISVIIDWAEHRLPAGRFTGIAAGGALILLVLISGRVVPVQFRGQGIAVASRIVSAVRTGYRRGTYILTDGGGRVEQYYLPAIPDANWLQVFNNPSPALLTRIKSRLCGGHVSVVILKMVQGSYYRKYDYQILNVIAGMRHRLAVTTGQGGHNTQVWQLASPGGDRSCP
jgi:hypothetical protein